MTMIEDYNPLSLRERHIVYLLGEVVQFLAEEWAFIPEHATQVIAAHKMFVGMKDAMQRQNKQVRICLIGFHMSRLDIEKLANSIEDEVRRQHLRYFLSNLTEDMLKFSMEV